jgi:ubiquinone/menaquinone biosynthesis C-methylase UbiE
MTEEQVYFERLAAAYVRGRLAGEPAGRPERVLTAPLAALTADDHRALIRLGLARELPLHRFKRTMGLPRVARVLGILRGLQPARLLDIGSGRGVFLWPLLDTFPDLPVTAVDRLPHRVADIAAVRAGGVAQLTASRQDATALAVRTNGADVVTMLEVLEHIPEAGRALAEACRVAGRFLILSVPSRPDNNPEHIHLFDRAWLTERLHQHGAARVSIEYVLNHLIVVARMGRP